MRLALLTDHRWVRPTRADAYTANLLEEDRLLAAALARLGVWTERVDWASDTDWSRFDAAVFRTTWDYFERLPEFLAWLDRVPIPLVNDRELVRWNLDKHYLAELPSVPTRFVERGDPRRLADLIDDEAVIKPAVSGAARLTWRVRPGATDALEGTWRDHLATGAWLVQPFQPDVCSGGEIAVVVVGGRVTHAVRKVPKPGDFRVQDDHGGTVHAHAPTDEERAFALDVVAACPGAPAYARVDAVRGRDGRLAVMELEVIEPELFLRFEPTAADALAVAVRAGVGIE
jgi:glutathione synthase/RimK-type ligase-like ATP-grasp enzyme